MSLFAVIWLLALVLVAGFINGSFATPMKYMTKWEEENIWLAFSPWGFVLLPWITILIMAPNVFGAIGALPTKLFWLSILGGLCFGLGQVAFAFSFRYIGIGLAFVINISMGTAGSALIPILWHKNIWGTTYSYIQLFGIMIFISAVSLGALAGAAREKGKDNSSKENEDTSHKNLEKGKFLLGVILAIFAGIGSVAQGTTYIFINPTATQIATAQFKIGPLGGSIITWVLIFTAAWIPYGAYFLLQNFKKRSFSNFLQAQTRKYWLLTVLMGLGFWGSLIFFSKASAEIGGELAPTIAWPLFMVFIILTSNFWSWKSGEWKGVTKKVSHKMLGSLGLFVLAIVVFAASSSFQPGNPATPDDHHHDVHYKHIQHDNYPTSHTGEENSADTKQGPDDSQKQGKEGE